jgi:hypothetical protein
MSTITEKLPVTFAGVDRPGTVPTSVRGFDVTRATIAELCKAHTLPEITVVQSPNPYKFIEATGKISPFLDLFHTATLSTRLVLGFQKAKAEEFTNLAPLLAKYPGISERVEFAARQTDLYSTLLEAYTKVLAIRSERNDPFVNVPSIAKAGRKLRAPSGRLDATRIAEVFGLSAAELARQIGVTRQRLSKTPDAEALQPLLRPYERIARLRTVFSDADFKAWLHTPNEHLEDGDPPIAYLKEGAREALAAFAENMLTGAPS